MLHKCVCFVHASMCAVYMCAHAYMYVLCACICTQGLRTLHPDQPLLCSSCYRKASDIFVQQSLACSDHTNHLIQPQLEPGRHTAYFSQRPKQKATSFPPVHSQANCCSGRLNAVPKTQLEISRAGAQDEVSRTRTSGHTDTSILSQRSLRRKRRPGEGAEQTNLHPLAKLSVLRTNWVP